MNLCVLQQPLYTLFRNKSLIVCVSWRSRRRLCHVRLWMCSLNWEDWINHMLSWWKHFLVERSRLMGNTSVRHLSMFFWLWNWCQELQFICRSHVLVYQFFGWFFSLIRQSYQMKSNTISTQLFRTPGRAST